MTTFRQLLEQFEESAKTRQAKGRVFEEFCEAYFQTDPDWASRFDSVWSWMDWPGRDGRADTGIDLVAREAGTGKLVAIQCKFYSPNATLQWGQVSTFAGMMSQKDFDYGLVVSTAGSHSAKALDNLARHEKEIRVVDVDDFEASRIDWDQFLIEKPTQLSLEDPKDLRPHQEKAVASVVEGFDLGDRGQLVMACGTGKTFTSLRLAEQMVGPGGSVLFLVPSISLLSQAVKEWANDSVISLATHAVCSDTQAGRRTKTEDMSVNDLSFPASTNASSLVERVTSRLGDDHMTVVFSTYQSIDVITEAQTAGLDEFDLVICDEAHRTTGAFKEETDRSAFTKVHENDYVRAAHRLYMTATPRVYGDQTKAKAKQSDVLVASMDDEVTFGPVFYELTFGDAVAQKLLTDYKVLVLAVNEDAVSSAFQRQLSDKDGELALGDAAKIVGCWHGLSKRGPQFGDDHIAMRRAVAFSSTIKQSKAFTRVFPLVVNEALQDRSDANAVMVETDHVDGSSNVKVRTEALNWLKESPGQRVCRVLSNAKCLTEGVDVPALDAVLFLQPRKSIVDVVQAVGRVMRLSPDKDFGYVILPIGVPAGVAPEEALRDNKKYQVVWQVLQALRSHDERLAAEINKIDINKRSGKIAVVGIGVDGGDDPDEPGVTTTSGDGEQGVLDLPDLGEWCDALYARIVEKVGDRRYMETWAADISAIASAQETRIRTLLDHPEQNPQAVERFDEFLGALRDNLNDGITREDAIGMLSQHLITRPVFEALFGGDEFTRHNPVSQVMQGMLDELDAANLTEETRTLEGFYNHIQMIIGGIDSAEGRQRVITELYEKFFKKALPKTAESLGIVYTPVEIVDFINRAVDDLLAKHFDGASISDEGVHVLDPFSGTGTFLARLLQSGLIRDEDLERKYRSELHANELMLLAYYIAAVNIETAYEGLAGIGDGYAPFDGIVLTDTFQLSEEGDPMDEVFFPRNNARADRQKNLDIRVIIGNPPYSVGQGSQNDDNQNLKYPTLDGSIEATYARRSSATNKNSLYDSYIRAMRWASDRIQSSRSGGVVGFVTNGGWLDGRTTDGLRRCFSDEFHHIYVFNLRGNQQGDWRREGGKVFGEGSQVTVAITLLVREPGELPESGARIHYRDIGDFLTADAKLDIVREATVDSLDWQTIRPNASGDWISQREAGFDDLVPLASGDSSLFRLTSNGAKTNRDWWIYGSSTAITRERATGVYAFLNECIHGFRSASGKHDPHAARRWVPKDPQLHSWNVGDYSLVAAGEPVEPPSPAPLREALYRPFFKQSIWFDPTLVERSYQLPSLCPSGPESLGFYAIRSNSKPFAVVATNAVPDVALYGAESGTYFSRWRVASNQTTGHSLFADSPSLESNLRGSAVEAFRVIDSDITEDEVFYYAYGVLHSQDLRERFAVGLRKEGPRIPIPSSSAAFRSFATAGRQLCDLHIQFESAEPHPLVEEWADNADPESNPDLLLVGETKMKYPKVTDPDTDEKVADKTRLIYNSHLTLSGIPLEAHEYVLGTRSGIDWIIDRWYVKTDKASGIVNDVNQWGLERGEPRYIIELIKRVVTVSVRTVEIVNSLPSLSFDE